MELHFDEHLWNRRAALLYQVTIEHLFRNHICGIQLNVNREVRVYRCMIGDKGLQL